MDNQSSEREYHNAKSNKYKSSVIFVLVTFFIGASILYYTIQSPNKNIKASLKATEKLGAFPIVQPTLKYGFVKDTLQFIEKEIQSGAFFSQLLQEYHVPYETIEKVARRSKRFFDIRHLRAGKNYTIITSDSTKTAEYMVYEPNVYEYIVFDLKDKLNAKRVKRPVEIKTRTSAGVVESSMWNAMVDNGMSFSLAARLEDALQWSIDFHHIQKNDKFKLVYEEKYIDGESVGVGDLHAAYFQNNGEDYYAFYYDSEDVEFEGYYDENGSPMKKGFLRSPVKYSRISSRYNLRRFHPVLKRVKAHLGTDYAAPYGTPILAVGNGVIERIGYTRGNGRFIKVRHDDTYQTQYLHMQKFADGMAKGTQVKQGQVIGYVGSTGLATGPHVCFRFWKNGKQVNHLALKFPPAKPLPENELEGFLKAKQNYLDKFGKIDFPTPIVEEILTEQSATTTDKNANLATL
ncbi:MAG: peptidoglycan DD-metalloendopeptidase family protein [Bacteroidota bacterium]